MYNVLAFIAVLLSCYFLLLALRPAGIAERVLVFFCLFAAHIVTFGYLLSSINCLSDIRDWAILSIITTLASAAIGWTTQSGLFITLPRFSLVSLMHTIASIKNWYTKDLSRFERLVLSPLILTTLLLGIINLIVIVFTAPHNWDGMAYHLARVAYYLQHQNLDYFDANYWAQVTHPKNSSLLLLYTYLISGNENLTQLVQFISYWVAMCSVYAISRKVGSNIAQSLFAAMVSALLTDWLMQATTTQNDLVLTAYTGATVYFLFSFRETCKWKYLALSGLGIGLAIGTKESFFMTLPSVGLLASYVLLFQSKINLRERLRNFAIWMACTLIAMCLFALPSGYIENYRNFGSPIGPKTITGSHSFEGKTIGYIIQNGTKNLIRYEFEFISLDGAPLISIVKKVQTLLKAVPEKIVSTLGIELETSEATRIAPFKFYEIPFAHEDISYWGILGFGIIWPIVLLSAIGWIKPTDFRVLAVAAILFLFSQAYSSPYDPWRGRYFTMAAIFAVPVVGVCLQTKNRFARGYLLMIVLAASIFAMSAVVLRQNSSLVSIDYQGIHRKSIFTMGRMEQLTRNGSEYYESLKRFDELIPKDAVVAVFLDENSFEYPLFGERLTRTIIPINSFDKGLQPVPANAEYLLYAKKFPCADRADIYLGADWHLRQLNDNNRRCP